MDKQIVKQLLQGLILELSKNNFNDIYQGMLIDFGFTETEWIRAVVPAEEEDGKGDEFNIPLQQFGYFVEEFFSESDKEQTLLLLGEAGAHYMEHNYPNAVKRKRTKKLIQSIFNHYLLGAQAEGMLDEIKNHQATQLMK